MARPRKGTLLKTTDGRWQAMVTVGGNGRRRRLPPFPNGTSRHDARSLTGELAAMAVNGEAISEMIARHHEHIEALLLAALERRHCDMLDESPAVDDLYFIESVGSVKIGRSKNAGNRFSNIQSSCPVPLRLRLVAVGCGYYERVLHDIFASERTHGEWFVKSSRLASCMDRVAPLCSPVALATPL